MYVDETYINTNHCTGKKWQPPDMNKGRKVPIGKGKRLIIIHAGTSAGFVLNCGDVFPAKSNNNDYHGEMNAESFKTWLQKKALPNVPKKSVFVLDNASYHSTQAEEDKSPTSSSRRQVMTDWLNRMGIPFNSKCTRPELYEIIKRHKPATKYEIDKLIKDAGHEVLRTPPYHCELQPIELVWGIMKQYVSQNNTDFNIEQIKQLVDEKIDGIGSEEWKNCIRHVL